jgi:hypothetical protein
MDPEGALRSRARGAASTKPGGPSPSPTSRSASPELGTHARPCSPSMFTNTKKRAGRITRQDLTRCDLRRVHLRDLQGSLVVMFRERSAPPYKRPLGALSMSTGPVVTAVLRAAVISCSLRDWCQMQRYRAYVTHSAEAMGVNPDRGIGGHFHIPRPFQHILQKDLGLIGKGARVSPFRWHISCVALPLTWDSRETSPSWNVFAHAGFVGSGRRRAAFAIDGPAGGA